MKKLLVLFLLAIFVISGCETNNNIQHNDYHKVTSRSEQIALIKALYPDIYEEYKRGNIKINSIVISENDSGYVELNVDYVPKFKDF